MPMIQKAMPPSVGASIRLKHPSRSGEGEGFGNRFSRSPALGLGRRRSRRELATGDQLLPVLVTLLDPFPVPGRIVLDLAPFGDQGNQLTVGQTAHRQATVLQIRDQDFVR